MANVIAQITTVDRTFPLGTVDQPVHFEIRRASDGFVLSEVDIDPAGTGVVFPAIPPGDYVVEVRKFDVVLTANVTVPATDVTLKVPATITITLE